MQNAWSDGPFRIDQSEPTQPYVPRPCLLDTFLCSQRLLNFSKLPNRSVIFTDCASWLREKLVMFCLQGRIGLGVAARLRACRAGAGLVNCRALSTWEPPSVQKSLKLGRPLSPHVEIYQPQMTWYVHPRLHTDLLYSQTRCILTDTTGSLQLYFVFLALVLPRACTASRLVSARRV